jgi:transcriptional regulator with XRE-family HTH domain
MSYYSTFWKRVKELIRAHRISQENFAAYVGMNYNTFKSCLYFDRIPDVLTGHRMATALGVSLEYLITGDNGKAMEDRKKQTLIRKNAAKEIQKMARKIEKDTRLIIK